MMYENKFTGGPLPASFLHLANAMGWEGAVIKNHALIAIMPDHSNLGSPRKKLRLSQGRLKVCLLALKIKENCLPICPGINKDI